jgi:GT2 family glycosyltransferase
MPVDGTPDPGEEGIQGVPDVAVVISTRNRATRLPRLASALDAQTLARDRFEVVIVDDASTDGTRVLLDDLSETASIPLRVIHRTCRGGAAAGRNDGWRSTRARFVAFTDDDCVPAADWLKAGLDAFERGAGVVVGRTEPPSDQIGLAARPFSLVLNVTSTQFLETCNVFYRRRDLERVGGLDERFRRPSGEDTDLGLRVLALGHAAVFADKAVVRHDVRTRTALEAVRESFRWRDLPLVVRGRPWVRRRLLHRWVFWKPSHPPVIAALAGLILGLRWRPALLLVVPWVGHRWRVDPACPDAGRRLATIPAAFAVDVSEVVTLAWGSVRHRALLL